MNFIYLQFLRGFLLIFPLLFFAIAGEAQEKEKGIRLGVIANLTEEPNIYGPSASFIRQTASGNRQEYSLEHIFWQKNVQDEVTNYQMRSQISYLYDMHFIKASNIQPYLGLGLLLSGEYEFYEFDNTTSYTGDNQAQTNLTSSILIAPSLHIKRDHWFIDVGFRYHIASFIYFISRVDDPTKPISEQRSHSTDLHFLSTTFSAGIGVGIML